MTEIHTCSYSCQRIECIRAQRVELRVRLEALTAVQQPEARGVVDAAWIDALHEKWMLDEDMRSFGDVLTAALTGERNG